MSFCSSARVPPAADEVSPEEGEVVLECKLAMLQIFHTTSCVSVCTAVQFVQQVKQPKAWLLVGQGAKHTRHDSNAHSSVATAVLSLSA